MAMVLKTYRADGTPIITALSKGGIYVETITREMGQGAITITYYDFQYRTLRVVQANSGSYTWATGVDGNGYPYLVINPITDSVNGGFIRLMVFAQ